MRSYLGVTLGLIGFVTLSISACEAPPSHRESAVQPDLAQQGNDAPRSPRELAEAAFASTVLVALSDAAGYPVGLGSGFAVAEGVVVTNDHVIAGAAAGNIRLIGQRQDLPILGVLARSASHDIAVLSVRGLSAPALRLANRLPSVGDPVFVAGNPRGLEGTFSTGIVSAWRAVGTDSLLQLTAPISPGSSGGPVLNEHGELIGIATATIRGGQNLNFAVPVAYLRPLLGNLGEPSPLRAGAERRGPSSILQSIGSRAVDGVEGGQFLWTTTNSFVTDGRFSITLRNRLAEPVRNVQAMVVFYDNQGQPLDYAVVRHVGTIPPGLATRAHSSVDFSVKRLTTSESNFAFNSRPRTRLEIRMLSFDLVDN